MSGEQYTQVRRPVSRLAEKVLGWLSWIFLLLLTIITMFIALVSFSSDTSIQNLETSLNGNDFVQQLLANNSLNTTQFVIWLQNGVWAVIVYFIICLLISFLALISMNIRVLSGFLFLVATLVTLPLVLLFVTLIIPILFLIIAIMMFARKEKVETVPAYYAEGNQGHYTDYEQHQEFTKPQGVVEPQNDDRQQTSDVEQQTNKDNQLRRGGYSSEIAEKVNTEKDASDEEPKILSRQAKYNYKNKKHHENQDGQQSSDDEFGQVSSIYDEKGKPVEDEMQHQQNDAMNEQAERERAETERYNQQLAEEEAQRKQAEYEEQQRLKQEKVEEAARLKQEKAEEKARIKQEKKERRQREKEKRKQRPSAVNQRRMNFEERKKVTSHDAEDQETNEASSTSEDQTKDKS